MKASQGLCSAEVYPWPVLQDHGICVVTVQPPAGHVDELQSVVLTHDLPVTQHIQLTRA